MRRSSRLSMKRSVDYDTSSDEEEFKKPKPTLKLKQEKLSSPESANKTYKVSPKLEPTENKVTILKPEKHEDSSSSESDIENYLQPADKIDLNSTFFQVIKKQEQSFEAIEKNIFSGVKQLNDSDSDFENVFPCESYSGTRKVKKEVTKHSIPIISFQHVQDYASKLEEAKKSVEEYEAKKRESTTSELNESTTEPNFDVSSLLAQVEGKLESSTGTLESSAQGSVHSSDYESLSESEKGDWEEVAEGKPSQEKEAPKNLQISVEMPTVIRKKKGKDLVASMKRRLNNIRKQNQILVHKVHLLCWLGHGYYINQRLNCPIVLAMSLSVIPTEMSKLNRSKDLEKLVNWYKETVTNIEKHPPKGMTLRNMLNLQLIRKEAFNKKMFVYLFICILRSLGIDVRLVLSFQVAPVRPPASELHSLSAKDNQSKKTKSKSKRKTEEDLSSDEEELSDEESVEKKEKSKKVAEKKVPKTRRSLKNKKNSEENTAVKSNGNENDEEDKVEKSKSTRTGKKNIKPGDKSNTNKETQEPKGKVGARNKKKNVKEKKIPDQKLSNENEDEDREQQGKTRKNKSQEIRPTRSSNNNKKPNLKESENNRDATNNNNKISGKTRSKSTKETSPSENLTVKVHLTRMKSAGDEPTTTIKGRRSLSLRKNNAKNIQQVDGADDSSADDSSEDEKPRRSQKLPDYKDVDSDDDFQPERPRRSAKTTKPKKPSKLTKKKSKSDGEDNDSDYQPHTKKDDSEDEFDHTQARARSPRKRKDEAEEPKPKSGFDVWIEVYLEGEEKWISVDVNKGQINCGNELHARASHPITYIVAWTNNNKLKEITQKYCPNFNTVTRKLRINKKWWEQSLKSFEGEKSKRDLKEDEEIAQLHLAKPLPTTIHAYKNHPLYVLKRHLLQFQALYPPDPAILGFVKGEAVYSRACVHTLHTREVWYKSAKVVKPGEAPYKVLLRPRWDKINRKILKNQPLDIFGEWQVDDYEPPTAQNGIVPRNEYGNVELFQECMLPKGTVHLPMPGLNKVARRMNIDCAPAMVGFDFHSGWNHPVYDGFVVCEEHADVLIAAWHMEQEEMEKREQEKLEKRVYDNWKKLIKGLLIRERLKARYEFGEVPVKKGGKRKAKGPKVVSKKRRACSDESSSGDD